MKTISPQEAQEMMKMLNIKPQQAPKISLDDEYDINWGDDDEVLDSKTTGRLNEVDGDLMESLLNPSSKLKVSEVIEKIQGLLIKNPLPVEDDDIEELLECGVRGKVWKLLLNLESVSAAEYAKLLEKGPSPVSSKIKKDIDRTFKNNGKFHGRVSKNELTRVLNAFAWKTHGKEYENGMVFSYVQGMNVLAGMFLYVMPELEAFHSFYKFIVEMCPSYVQPTLVGVHNSCKLLDECFKELDSELHQHMTRTIPTAEIYALPPLLSFGACTPTLDQAVLLWDFLLAFGLELNIILTIAQITLIREKLLKTSSPMQYLRTLPDLNAKLIMDETKRHLSKITPEMYRKFSDTFFDSHHY